jgi:erythromycin esterase-like protein
MKPSGVFLAEWLKDDVYTIGMTTYQGQDGLATADAASPIAPAEDGSLESRLHRLGKLYVFLDVRSVRGSHKHPLHTPQSMRIPKYDNNTLPELTKAFDAVFYIDHMAPATRIGGSKPA